MAITETLVAVHVPKSAGTSMREALVASFGERMLLDNGDRPLAHARWVRRLRALETGLRLRNRTLPVACVYGHFLPLKYAWIRQARYCIWLRDPVQRVVSRYHHYRRHVDDEPQHRRWGLVPGLSLEAFVRLPQYRNTCAEYLWGFPLERFDFVGVVERLDADWTRFRQAFPVGASNTSRANANPDKGGGDYHLDARMAGLIRDMNRRDMAIYERALALPLA